jgi:dipeptide/tripeptide permease
VLSFALAALGTFTAIISFVVRSKLLRESVEKQDQKLVQSAQVVGCALCEVPALLGVMAKFTLPGNEFWLLFAISIVTMALHFPRKANLLDASYKDPSFGASS